MVQKIRRNVSVNLSIRHHKRCPRTNHGFQEYFLLPDQHTDQHLPHGDTSITRIRIKRNEILDWNAFEAYIPLTLNNRTLIGGPGMILTVLWQKMNI